jgi:hypothetical protein
MKKSSSNINSFYPRLQRDSVLLVTCPREFIYTFFYSPEKKVKIYSYSPKLRKFGMELIERIAGNFPELKIHFVGSVALGLSGVKDVDIVVECSPLHFTDYIKYMTEFLGKPKKITPNFIEWQCIRKDFQIEVLFIDPSCRLFKLEMEAFTKLKKSKRYLAAYERMKQEANGISYREYQRRKLAFFHNVVGISYFPGLLQINSQFFSDSLLSLRDALLAAF